MERPVQNYCPHKGQTEIYNLDPATISTLKIKIPSGNTVIAPVHSNLNSYDKRYSDGKNVKTVNRKNRSVKGFVVLSAPFL